MGRHEHLSDGLEHLIGRNAKVAPVPPRRPLASSWYIRTPLRRLAGAAEQRQRPPILDAHAVDLRELLLVRRRRHRIGPRRYTIVTSSAPSRLVCTAMSTAVLPPPIATTPRPTEAGRDPATDAGARYRRPHPRHRRDLRPQYQRLVLASPMPREHGIVLLAQSTQRDIAPERVIGPHLIPPMARMKSTSRCANWCGVLYAAIPYFVQTGELRPGFEHRHGVAEHGEPVRHRTIRRAAANHRNAFAACRCALKRLDA